MEPRALFTYVVAGMFLLFVAGIVTAAAIDSVAGTWFRGWLPDSWSLQWYRYAFEDLDLARVLTTTAVVCVTVTAIALIVGTPAAYALARVRWPGRPLVMTILVLPLLVPDITYGLPLATLLLTFHLSPWLPGVIVADLVPALPFVVLILTPFFEQIDPSLEGAARVLGSSPRQVFARVLAPLAAPGVLAAGLLVLVRTLALFELTFLTSGAATQTLIVALYAAVFGAGMRPEQAIDAMATIYMATTLVLLVPALRIIRPALRMR